MALSLTNLFLYFCIAFGIHQKWSKLEILSSWSSKILNNMKFILFICALIATGYTFGQQGKVEVIKDGRLDLLVRKQGTAIPPATSPQIPGYRLQLFFDSDKKRVDEARSKFISSFPKVDTYVTYTAPNYFLKVGDFRTHIEAEKIKSAVDRDFPTSFIVKELINLPRIDQ